MGKRVLLGALVGTLVAFVVSTAWHLAPVLGEVGVKALPNEGTVLDGLRGTLHEPAFYIFPAPVPGAAQADYMAKYQKGPTGILIYKPGGEGMNFIALLINQFLITLFAALLLSCMLALVAGGAGYGQRVLLVMLAVAVGGVLYDLPTWNWYGTPALYILNDFASWFASWTVAALVMAAVVKRPATAP